jgi:protoporphyrinogen oxidase
MAIKPDALRSIAIIGSGFSGLCLGIQLKKLGYESFTIFETADSVGGTWRDNVYPGQPVMCLHFPTAFRSNRRPIGRGSGRLNPKFWITWKSALANTI